MGTQSPNNPQQNASTIPDGLWMFLATVAAVDDTEERARLAATAIPAFLSCTVSGITLAGGSGARWTHVIQRDGQILNAEAVDACAAALDRLVEGALEQGATQTHQRDASGLRAEAEQVLRALDVQCLVINPLRTLHHQFGALIIGWMEIRQLDSNEDALLRSLAQQLAITCENTQLRRELQRHVTDLEGIVQERTSQLRRSEQRQRALLEINNAIVTNLDRSSLIHAVACELAKVMSFDRASLAAYDRHADELQVSGLTLTSDSRSRIQKGDSFARKGCHLQSVIDERRPRIRPDLQSGERTAVEDQLLAEGIRSYLAVPLIVQNDVIGTLNVGSAEVNAFADDDAEFLTEVAAQVALAFDNMLAYEEINQLKLRLEEENLYLREEVESEREFADIIGNSGEIRALLVSVRQVAPTDATVLLTGETGTGKELVARAIHNASERKDQTMVMVNCAALPAGLLESELFGHEKGAFTGAIERKVGRFELANHSTLFLDEIGDLPIELQAKLLRALQEGTFERVGSTETQHVDVRIVAATNRDLSSAVNERTFREDLFYRLNVFPVHVPALREHKDDIPLLVRHFVMRYAGRMGKKIETIPKATLDAMSAYPWPGNVRELQNVIQRAVILSQGSRLEIHNLLPQSASTAEPSEVHTLDELQRKHILRVLESTAWRVSGGNGAAKILGVKPTTLEARMKKLGISRPNS